VRKKINRPFLRQRRRRESKRQAYERASSAAVLYAPHCARRTRTGLLNRRAIPPSYLSFLARRIPTIIQSDNNKQRTDVDDSNYYPFFFSSFPKSGREQTFRRSFAVVDALLGFGWVCAALLVSSNGCRGARSGVRARRASSEREPPLPPTTRERPCGRCPLPASKYLRGKRAAYENRARRADLQMTSLKGNGVSPRSYFFLPVITRVRDRYRSPRFVIDRSFFAGLCVLCFCCPSFARSSPTRRRATAPLAGQAAAAVVITLLCWCLLTSIRLVLLCINRSNYVRRPTDLVCVVASLRQSLFVFIFLWGRGNSQRSERINSHDPFARKKSYCTAARSV